MVAIFRTSNLSDLGTYAFVIYIVLCTHLEGTEVHIVPHDAPPGHIVTQLSNTEQQFKILNKNTFSDFFKNDDVKASHPDQHRIRYKCLTHGHNFRLDRETGAIYLGKEQVTSGVYLLRVVTMNDAGHMSKPVKVTLIVSGYAQHDDVVLRRLKRAIRTPKDKSVPEDTKGVLVTIPKINAADRFTLATQLPDFLLDQVTGTISLRADKTLDYEITASYLTKVNVARKGDPSCTSLDGGRINIKRTFDREKQKYYIMPIVMAARHGVSGTNTLTVTTGDQNDNDQKPGHKEITIYNYKGEFKHSYIGHAYEEDPDDWDKIYSFAKDPGPYFSINASTGAIYLINHIHQGTYPIEVWVNDTVRGAVQVVSTVLVHSVTIGTEPVYNAASFRLKGITAELFIEQPKNITTPADPKAYCPSMYTLFREAIAKILKTQLQFVEIFAVRNCADEPNCCDVRYSAHGSPYYKQSRMDGLMNDNIAVFNDLLKNNGHPNAAIEMTPIDLCLKEVCEAGCTNVLTVGPGPKVINMNSTSLVGIDTYITAKCECKLKDVSSAPIKCDSASCFNGGTCQQRTDGFSCKCPIGFDGSRCQQTKRQFDNGWAWYPALKQCLDSHTFLSFVTSQDEGMVLYNGPVRAPFGSIRQDFIAIELIGGYPKVTIDHGSGPGSVLFDGKLQDGAQQIQKLSDGKWHRLDVFRQGKFVSVVIDLCQGAPSGSTQDRFACEKTMTTPGSSRFINTNQPLQLGGRKDPNAKYPPNLTNKGFKGCMKDLTHDGELYDLYIGAIGEQLNTKDGCPDEAAKCGDKCVNGSCVANLVGNLPNGKTSMCNCNPGFKGDFCNIATTEVQFAELDNSVITWKLSQSWFDEWKDEFSSEIRVMFRTRQPIGVIMYFKSRDSINEFMLLRIRDYKLVFEYNLGISDKELSLPYVKASDGEWHSVHVQRFGRIVTLKMDIGEGKFYSSTPGVPTDHQLTLLEGTVLGGADEYKDSCLQDPRYKHGWLPVLPSEVSPYATIFESKGVSAGCPSNACAVKPSPCRLPFVCVDKWRLAACECTKGQVEATDPITKAKTCVYVNPCLSQPCVRGVCVSLGQGAYECNCEEGWERDLCDVKGTTTTPPIDVGGLIGGLVAAVIAGLVILGVIVVLWKRGVFPKTHRHSNADDSQVNDDTRIELTTIGNSAEHTYANIGPEYGNDAITPTARGVLENEPASPEDDVSATYDYVGRPTTWQSSGASGSNPATSRQANETEYANVLGGSSAESGLKDALGQNTAPAGQTNQTEQEDATHYEILRRHEPEGTYADLRSSTQGDPGQGTAESGSPQADRAHGTRDDVAHDQESQWSPYARLDQVHQGEYMDFRQLSLEQLKPI